MNEFTQRVMLIVLGGLIISFIEYFFGENTALAVIGGWILNSSYKAN